MAGWRVMAGRRDMAGRWDTAGRSQSWPSHTAGYLASSLMKDRKTEPKPGQIFEKTENPDNQKCQDRANSSWDTQAR